MEEFIGKDEAFVKDWLVRHGLEKLVDVFKGMFGMISVQVPTSLCMQNKLIIHLRYCFEEQYVYPREPNIYMGNLYLRDE